MKLVGVISTAALSLILGVAAPVYAQEQHEQQDQQKDEQRDKSVQQDEKKAQQEKTAKPEEKNAQKQEQHAEQGKPEHQEQNARGNSGRIPDDRYRANFGREHTFRVSQSDYSSRRFQYSGYSFGFVDPWPSNWLYTQNVYVVYINGVYYLCNPAYPGVNIALSIAL